jgi:hypothetical protein
MLNQSGVPKMFNAWEDEEHEGGQVSLMGLP